MDKASIRQRFRGVPVTGSEVVVDGLFAWLSARLPATIATYSALPDEVEIGPLIDRLPGWFWVLPRIEADGALTWRDARAGLETHRWGINQPAESAPIVDRFNIDYFLVPGLAFDNSGGRLGRGKGFYDLELRARRTDAVAIGVTVEERVLDAVPVEDHDERVGYLASESGVTATIV